MIGLVGHTALALDSPVTGMVVVWNEALEMDTAVVHLHFDLPSRSGFVTTDSLLRWTDGLLLQVRHHCWQHSIVAAEVWVAALIPLFAWLLHLDFSTGPSTQILAVFACFLNAELAYLTEWHSHWHFVHSFFYSVSQPHGSMLHSTFPTFQVWLEITLDTVIL